jgi:hypothetical protein
MATETIIVDRQGTSARSAKITDQRELLVKINSSSIDPIIINSPGTQSSILNIPISTTGTFNTPAVEIYIMNTGSSNILIEGKVIGPGLSFPWKGSFTYNSQSSTILIIFSE